jgi:hypothetical protein
MKLFLLILQILIGLYFAGSAVRQNRKIDDIVKLLESGYSSFNRKLKNSKIPDGIIFLKRIYGYGAISIFIFFFIFGRFFRQNSNILGIISIGFIVTFFCWFSIEWCLQHKHALKRNYPHAILFIFSPMLMALIDFAFGTPFNELFIELLRPLIVLLGIEQIELINPIAIGGIFSIILIFAFLIFYITTWVFAIPFAFMSIVIISSPVLFARFIHTIAPEKNFVGLTMLVFIVVSLWLTYN